MAEATALGRLLRVDGEASANATSRWETLPYFRNCHAKFSDFRDVQVGLWW
jgi:hypothetical protein